MNLSSPGVSEIWMKLKQHMKETKKKRTAKKKSAMEFNMNTAY